MKYKENKEIQQNDHRREEIDEAIQLQVEKDEEIFVRQCKREKKSKKVCVCCNTVKCNMENIEELLTTDEA